LLLTYRKHFAFWKKDVKTHAVSLPPVLETRAVERAAIEVRGAKWELRGAEVSAAGDDWVDLCATLG